MKALLLLPAVALFSLFTAWPLVEVVRMSLYKTNFISSVFVGLDNYVQALSSREFTQAMWNTIWYIIILVPAQTVTALFASFFVYDMKKGWLDAARIVFYVPVLSAGMIIAQSWKWVFHANGPVNWILQTMGAQKIMWFAQGETAIPVISLIVVFSSFGANVLIFLSAIVSIEKSLLDAARVDGASSFQLKTRILLPLLKPTIGMVMLLSAIGAMQVFENIYALVPQSYAATMTFFIYQQSFEFSKWGYASAEAVILLMVTLGLSMFKGRAKN